MSFSKTAFAARILVFCLNLAMLLIATFLIVWGSSMLNTPFDRDLKDVVFNYNSSEPLASDKSNMRAWVWSVFWSMFGLSIVAFFIAIIGLIGAISHRKAVIATFLILVVPFILLEFGGAITVWSKRGSLRKLINEFVADMYSVRSLFDIGVIESTYSCCGTIVNKCDQRVTCDVAMFNSIDNTMMIAGLVFLPVLIAQLLLIALPAVVLRMEPRAEDGECSGSQTRLIDTWTS